VGFNFSALPFSQDSRRNAKKRNFPFFFTPPIHLFFFRIPKNYRSSVISAKISLAYPCFGRKGYWERNYPGGHLATETATIGRILFCSPPLGLRVGRFLEILAPRCDVV